MEQAGCVTPEEAAEFSKWVIRFSGEGLRKMGETNYVILSRSPVDIVRMSDISGIDSCHGKGGRYYHCALDEARQDAGFVGFLVKPEQLNKFTKEEIENSLEIFQDNDRGVGGMSAFGRIRIRAIDIKGSKQKIGVTEPVIYGISRMKNQGNTIQFPGVFSTVRRFLRQKQNLPTVDQFKDLFRNGDVKLLGGSYLDSGNLQSLVGNFYDTDEDFEGDEEHVVEDRADIMERELRTIQNESGIDDLPHVHASFDVNVYGDDDEYVEYTASGGISINLSEYDVDLDIFDNYYERYEVQRMADDRGGSYNPDVRIFFQALMKNLKSETSTDDYEIGGVSFSDHADVIHIEKSITGSEDSMVSDPDDYYTFIEGLKSWGNSYEDFLKAVLMSLRRAGLYSPAAHEYDTEDEIDEEMFKHVAFDEDDNTGNIIVGEILHMNRQFTQAFAEERPSLMHVSQSIARGLTNYIHDHFKQGKEPVEVIKHPEFNFESIQFRFQPREFTIVVGNKYEIPCTITPYGDAFGVQFQFQTRNLTFMKFVDDHYFDFENIIIANILAMVPAEKWKNSSNLNMIAHTYRKYAPNQGFSGWRR
jgi:hypothetical protein